VKKNSYHHGNLRNQLIEIGIEIINQEGLEHFSLRKVAAKCNVSHTAPYSHFKDIDSLISTMCDHVTEQFMNKLHSSVQHAENNLKAVSSLGQAYIDFFIENPQYFQFIFYHSGVDIDLDNISPNDYPPFALFRTTAYQMFEEIKLPQEKYSENLIILWSVVHGIASLSTNTGIQYSGNWSTVFSNIIKQKEIKI